MTEDDGLMIGFKGPAQDSGTATGAPGIDIVGIKRPQGAAHDIGAYELP